MDLSQANWVASDVCPKILVNFSDTNFGLCLIYAKMHHLVEITIFYIQKASFPLF
jgi:hypothetical protein